MSKSSDGEEFWMWAVLVVVFLIILSDDPNDDTQKVVDTVQEN